MKWNIILSHELNKLYLLRVLPPVSPLLSIVGSDRYIPNWGIKPDIKALRLESLNGNWNSPFQVSCDASWSESLVQPRVSNRDCIGSPVGLSSLGSELLNFRLKFL